MTTNCLPRIAQAGLFPGMKLPIVLLLSSLGFAACTDVATEALRADPSTTELGADHERPRAVFATSATYAGDALGGLDGADAICAQHAADAGLRGRFKAWLSDADTSAASRLSHARVPYRLVGAGPIARNWDDLTDGKLRAAIDHDETGAALPPATDIFTGLAVWTATHADGSNFPFTPGGDPTSNPQLDCEGWTGHTLGVGLLGIFDRTDQGWTASFAGIGCTEKARLYCLEQ